MSLDTHGRGGVRPGAGRPKKKARDLQKTHSIRATDKDWKEIQTAARVIKACRSIDKRPHIFFLSDEENIKVSNFLLQGLIEKRQTQKWGPPVLPAVNIVQQDLETPQTKSEEEAVSIFLEYFRLDPAAAINLVSMKLDRERNIREFRRRNAEQKRVMDELQERADDAIKDIDDINERVAEMLKFPGYRKY